MPCLKQTLFLSTPNVAIAPKVGRRLRDDLISKAVGHSKPWKWGRTRKEAGRTHERAVSSRPSLTLCSVRTAKERTRQGKIIDKIIFYNKYVVMVPAFDSVTGELPAGEHPAGWDEVYERFGWNEHRRWLLAGLLRAAKNLRDAGCTFFLLDGSFVTSKEDPSDYDACCDYSGMDPFKIDPHLLSGKKAMKAEFRGEIHPESHSADGISPFREFFQTDRNGTPKGVVILDLSSLP